MKNHLLVLLTPFFEMLVLILYILCVLVLLWGIVLAMKDFFTSEMSHPSRKKSSYVLTSIRSFLGSYILLSLEILIAADIVHSIINPSFQDLITLGAMVVIRTVMAYFLHKEMLDAKKEQHEEESVKIQ